MRGLEAVQGRAAKGLSRVYQRIIRLEQLVLEVVSSTLFMERIEFTRLWDVYGGMLTAAQREICDLYFIKDLSLTEIAEEKGISKQGVSECLNKCRQKLIEAEEKLGVVETVRLSTMQTELKISEALSWADEFGALHPEYAADIAALREIFKKDYSAEARAALEKTKNNGI